MALGGVLLTGTPGLAAPASCAAVRFLCRRIPTAAVHPSVRQSAAGGVAGPRRQQGMVFQAYRSNERARHSPTAILLREHERCNPPCLSRARRVHLAGILARLRTRYSTAPLRRRIRTALTDGRTGFTNAGRSKTRSDPRLHPCTGKALGSRLRVPSRGQLGSRTLGAGAGAPRFSPAKSARSSKDFARASPNASCPASSAPLCSAWPPTCTAIGSAGAMTHISPTAGRIASGAVEGACKNLIKDRMERSGMRWTEAMAEAVVKLRAVYLSGDFDNYWLFHILQEQNRLHANSRAVVPK